MAWRLAGSLVRLRDQVNAAYPGRNKASDGTIGDAAHSKTVSDHNPNGAGVVTAFDITHDPGHGLDIWTLANKLVGDGRVKYLIVNNKIYIDGRWQNYTGSDPHTSHLHVSVNDNYNQTQPWNITNNQQGNNDVIENTSEWRDYMRVVNSEVAGWDFEKVHTGVYDAQEMNAWQGQPATKFLANKWTGSEAYRIKREQLEKTNAELAAQLKATYEPITETVYRKK